MPCPGHLSCFPFNAALKPQGWHQWAALMDTPCFCNLELHLEVVSVLIISKLFSLHYALAWIEQWLDNKKWGEGINGSISDFKSVV